MKVKTDLSNDNCEAWWWQHHAAGIPPLVDYLFPSSRKPLLQRTFVQQDDDPKHLAEDPLK